MEYPDLILELDETAKKIFTINSKKRILVYLVIATGLRRMIAGNR
jgi:hypothetical protein